MRAEYENNRLQGFRAVSGPRRANLAEGTGISHVPLTPHVQPTPLPTAPPRAAHLLSVTSATCHCHPQSAADIRACSRRHSSRGCGQGRSDVPLPERIVLRGFTA